MKIDCRFDLDGRAIAWKKLEIAPAIGSIIRFGEQMYIVVNRMIQFPRNWNMIALMVEPVVQP